MRKVSLLFFAWAGSLALGHAQNASAVLDVNEIRSVIFPKNGLFWDGMNAPSYEVPAGSGNHSMYLGNLWLMGNDLNSISRGFYNRYRFADADTIPGPLTTDGLATTTQAIADQYKRVWKINQWEIDLLLQAQGNGQLASGAYVAPADIEEWPANPPAAGYADSLAPFHDANADGLYDIHDGDYPIIKGEQMLYFIINDLITTVDPGNPLPQNVGTEIHVSIYACKKASVNDSTDIINYISFVEYDIYNRGVVTLLDAYAGFNTDADIGYPFDDYVGSHVDANAFYFYNGDAFDGPGTVPAVGTYGQNSPVQSIQFLEDHNDMVPGLPNMGGFMSYANSSGATGDPTSPTEHYNYMRGYWKNGAHLVYGGDGFAGSAGATALEARYMFPGNSDPGNVGTGSADPGFIWTQPDPCPTCPQTAANDQRGVGSAGPFDLSPGGNIKLVLGLITTFDSTLTIAQRIEKNREQNKWLKTWYDDGDLPCVMSTVPLSTPDVSVAQLSVYPNPATHVLSVSGAVIHAGTAYELVDIHGRKLRSGKGQAEGVIQLPVDDLASGIYFVRLHGNGQSHIVKFIKK